MALRKVENFLTITSRRGKRHIRMNQMAFNMMFRPEKVM